MRCIVLNTTKYCGYIEYYKTNKLDGEVFFVTPGAAAYAEFNELHVKDIRITVEVPEGQQCVGLSEIRILGK